MSNHSPRSLEPHAIDARDEEAEAAPDFAEPRPDKRRQDVSSRSEALGDTHQERREQLRAAWSTVWSTCVTLTSGTPCRARWPMTSLAQKSSARGRELTTFLSFPFASLWTDRSANTAEASGPPKQRQVSQQITISQMDVQTFPVSFLAGGGSPTCGSSSFLVNPSLTTFVVPSRFCPRV